MNDPYQGKYVPSFASLYNTTTAGPRYRAAGECPTHNPLALVVWVIITGQVYHSTRVHALLHTIVPYMEAAYVFSDVTEERYCTTMLQPPAHVIDRVRNDPRCTNHNKVDDTLHCGWMLAQLRWPHGLLRATELQPHAQWINIIDDDSFIIIPTVLRHLESISAAQHDLEAASTSRANKSVLEGGNRQGRGQFAHTDRAVYAVGCKGNGGAGHFFNRAWFRAFCKANAQFCSVGESARAPSASAGTNATLWCENTDSLSDFISSSDGGLVLCHGKVDRVHGATLLDLRSRGAINLFLSWKATAFDGLRALDLPLVKRDVQAFGRQKLAPVIHVTLKFFAESAFLLHEIFYNGRVDLLTII